MQFRKCVSGVGECGAQMGWEQFAELDHVLERISWFFPRHMSVSAQCLIVGMMHPDASVRITVAQSLEHPWLVMSPEEHSKTLPAQVSQPLRAWAYSQVLG